MPREHAPSASSPAPPSRRSPVPNASRALIAVVLLVAVGAWWFSPDRDAPAYQTARVERATLAAAVLASGTLLADGAVDVRAAVTGEVKELLVDVRSAVAQGDVLLRLDAEMFEARLQQAQADVEATRASLAASGRSRHDAGELAELRALLAQREAALGVAQSELAHTTVRAPIAGTVIARGVEVGQFVDAASNAPSLFTIVPELRRLRIEAAVDEMRAGRIQPRQPVLFTVDALPDRSFRGDVMQVRKANAGGAPFTVIISADNPDVALMPGMKAHAQIVVEVRQNVLTVPNAALVYRLPNTAPAPSDGVAPAASQAAEMIDIADAQRQRLVQALGLDAIQQERLDELYAEQRRRVAELSELPTVERRTRADGIRADMRQRVNGMLAPDQQRIYAGIIAAEAAGDSQFGRVYVVGSDGRAVEVRVRLGITDGRRTEIVSGDLREGAAVIVGGG